MYFNGDDNALSRNKKVETKQLIEQKKDLYNDFKDQIFALATAIHYYQIPFLIKTNIAVFSLTKLGNNEYLSSNLKVAAYINNEMQPDYILL
jgi:hypothetical protein